MATWPMGTDKSVSLHGSQPFGGHGKRRFTVDLPPVYDMNVLYDAYRASMRSSPWKEESQRFETDFLSELTKLHHELKDRTYKTSQGSDFLLNERGKTRHVHGGRMRDRVARHALCDSILSPALKPYIIHNNYASQAGKGVDAARRAFERDLHNFYLEYGDNNGWVLFMDFSKYYDNIRHDRALELITPHIDEDAAWLLTEILHTFRVDVSYMTDEEYAGCMDEKFDSVRYFDEVPYEARTGEKFMAKGVDIGDQVSQNVGVFFPTRLDNYVTVVRGCRRYGRYMDDSYAIHRDRGYLIETAKLVSELAEAEGLYVNDRKTRIVRLGDTYTFLKFKYSLTESGRVVKRISPESVTRARRRLKAYRRLAASGRMTCETVEQAYGSWMGRYAKLMSRKQRENMKTLYRELFGAEAPRWKRGAYEG